MKTIDKEMIKEDLEFIHEYMTTLIERHPELINEEDILRKITRRMQDIDNRLDA